METVAGVLMIGGAFFAMVGGIGVVKFGDLMSRMHAAAKAPTLGMLLAAVGAAIQLDSTAATETLVLVVVLQLLTSPVATHMLGRAAHGKVPVELDGGDALAERIESTRDQA